MTHSLHCRLLVEAAHLLGGRAQLGRELHLPAQDLARWMAGLEPMPRPVFLKVVDLVIDMTSATHPRWRSVHPCRAAATCVGRTSA